MVRALAGDSTMTRGFGTPDTSQPGRRRCQPPSPRERPHGGGGNVARRGRTDAVPLDEGTAMDLEPSARGRDLRDRLLAFMDEHVYPAEAVYEAQMAEAGDPHHHP